MGCAPPNARPPTGDDDHLAVEQTGAKYGIETVHEASKKSNERLIVILPLAMITAIHNNRN
jgi:hypothetical protein